MTTFREKLEPTGHLEIIKVFPDNTREVLLDDHNIITKGMGITLVSMFAHDDATDSFENFAIPYFQMGSTAASMVSSLEKLSDPLDGSAYSTTDLTISSVQIQGATGLQDVVALNPAYMLRSAYNKITYSVTLDESTANGVDIAEVGLFSKNPYIKDPPVSFLCAYRSFAAIPKRESYTLIFNWTIEF